MPFSCPNPNCDYVGKSPRDLQFHFNNLRGQQCIEINRLLSSVSSRPNGRDRNRNVSSLAIHQYHVNNNHRNYDPLSNMFNHTGSHQLTIADCNIESTNNDNQYVDDNNGNATNDDNSVQMIDDNNTRFNNESFTYTPHQLMVAKLLLLLDSWNAPNYCFQQIVDWYEEARIKGVSFSNEPVTREANMRMIHRAVPNNLSSRYFPHTTTVELHGFTDPVELVRFDFVEMVLSLLHDPEVMDTNNLVINPDSPFDNGITFNNLDTCIGEPRTAKVYQDYLSENPPSNNEFVFDLIIYIDRTHIDVHSRFTVCPLVFTSSLFTEKARKNHTMWCQLGYMFDVHQKSSAENTTSMRGHSAINSHRQLSVLLDGLLKVQNGHDNRLQNVPVTIDGKTCYVNIKVPILYFMNDAKEGDMLCCRVASHHPSTNCHCRVCDVVYDDMLNFDVECNVREPKTIESLVDQSNHNALDLISQYCIKSCFRDFTFCNPVFGIFGSQPGDILHMFNLGCVKEVTSLLFDCLTPKQKAELDSMGRRFNARLRQTHRRNFPTTDFSRGITNTKQKHRRGIHRFVVYAVCVDEQWRSMGSY